MEKPTQSVLPRSPAFAQIKSKPVSVHLAKPVTITLFKDDLDRITAYRAKRAGEGSILNVSEVVREAIQKL